MKAAIFACVLGIAAAGCTTTSGVQVQQSQLASFKKGITTDTDVISALGGPTTSSVTSDGERVLVYAFAQYKIRGSTFVPVVGLFSGGSDMTTNSVVFKFDRDRKLISYAASESQINSGMGAAAAVSQQAPR